MAYDTVADYLKSITAYGENLGEESSVDLMHGGWRRTNAPRVIANAALQASQLARESEELAFAAFAEGRGRSEIEAERQMMNSLSSSGVSPAAARAMIAERRATSLGTDLATRRGELALDRAGTEMGIISSTAGALVQAEQNQDAIDHREEMFQRQLAEQKKARKWGLIGDLAGAAIGVGLGPAGQFGKTVLGQAMGFGGGGSYPTGSWSVGLGNNLEVTPNGPNPNRFSGPMFESWSY